MDHDGYSLFNHYWWLIFPLFWMAVAMARLWSRHTRANRALDIIKSYADQGKEPPPDLMKAVQPGQGNCDWDGRRWRSPEERLTRAFFFAALACAFGFLAFWPQLNGDENAHHIFGLVFVAAITAALAISNLLSAMLTQRPPYDKDGNHQ
jgi:hypothetical protein